MIRVAVNMNAVYVNILAIALLVLCGFGSSFERCQKVEKRVRGVCPFYNKTTSGPHFDHIADTEDSAIFHFVPLFYTGCSPLSQILVCSALFPFRSRRHSVVSLPCQHVCFSVYAACNHVFTSYHQQWPVFRNCSSLPSPPRLCLQLSSFINFTHHTSLLSTPSASSSPNFTPL